MNVPPPYTPPGTPVQQQQPAVPNHLVWAIIVTVLGFCLCCVVGAIPGVVAIVFSTQVNTKLSQGDFDGALRASANAKIWCWVTTGLVILGVLLSILSAVTGTSQEYIQMMEQMQQH